MVCQEVAVGHPARREGEGTGQFLCRNIALPFLELS